MIDCAGYKCKMYEEEHSPECLHDSSKTQGWEYPTKEDFNNAIDELFLCFDIAGSRAAILQKIRSMRILKTTWVGKDENELRFKLDKLLDEFGKGNKYTTDWRPAE